MELNKEEEQDSVSNFASDIQTGSIWSTPELDDEELEKPAFLRRRERRNKEK